MIEWDRWRNRFLQAVLTSTTEILNSDQAQSFQYNPVDNAIESKFPLGTTAWFICTISNDRQIKNARIVRSSGFSGYDQAVLEAIQAMKNSNILKFPNRSKRISILQAGGVERTTNQQNQYFHFNDIEHYHIPSN
jgi:TonB family protein